MKKGLKRAGICFLVMLSLRCGGLLAEISAQEAVVRKWENCEFSEAVEKLGNREEAGEYVRRTFPKLKELAALAVEEMKNMFPKE